MYNSTKIFRIMHYSDGWPTFPANQHGVYLDSSESSFYPIPD